MFKIRGEIASNVHSPATCKMYTKIQNPPPFLLPSLARGLLLQSEEPPPQKLNLVSPTSPERLLRPRLRL